MELDLFPETPEAPPLPWRLHCDVRVCACVLVYTMIWWCFFVLSAVSLDVSDAGDLLDDDSLYESVGQSSASQMVRL